MEWMNRKNKGQALLEFTLVALLLIALLFGIAEFSRAWWTVSVLTDATREAVRIYATDNVAGAVNAAAVAAAIVARVPPPGFPPPPPVELRDYGQTVTATQNYRFRSVVGNLLPGLDNYPLRITTSMRKEYP